MRSPGLSTPLELRCAEQQGGLDVGEQGIGGRDGAAEAVCGEIRGMIEGLLERIPIHRDAGHTVVFEGAGEVPTPEHGAVPVVGFLGVAVGRGVLVRRVAHTQEVIVDAVAVGELGVGRAQGGDDEAEGTLELCGGAGPEGVGGEGRA